MHIRQSKEYHHKQVILFYYEYIKKVIGILLLESNNLKTLIVFKKEGCTIIMVTHDIQLAEECDRVIDLNGYI